MLKRNFSNRVLFLSFILAVIGVCSTPSFSQDYKSSDELQRLLSQANQLHQQKLSQLVKQREQLQFLKQHYQSKFSFYNNQAMQVWGLSAVSATALLILETQSKRLGSAGFFLASASLTIANTLAAIYRFQIGHSLDAHEIKKARQDLRQWIDQTKGEFETYQSSYPPELSEHLAKVLLSLDQFDFQLFNSSKEEQAGYVNNSLINYGQTAIIQSAVHGFLAIRAATLVYYQRMSHKPKIRMSGYFLGAQVLTLFPSLVSSDFQLEVFDLIDHSIKEIDHILLLQR